MNALETARAWPSWEQASQFMAAALIAIRREPPPAGASRRRRLLADLRAGSRYTATCASARTSRGGRCASSAGSARAPARPSALFSRCAATAPFKVVARPLRPSPAARAGCSREARGARRRSCAPAARGRPRRRRPAPRRALPAALAGARSGPAAARARARRPDGPMRVAAVIPSFRRGSGGHATIVQPLLSCAAAGTSVGLAGGLRGAPLPEPAADTTRRFPDFFGPTASLRNRLQRLARAPTWCSRRAGRRSPGAALPGAGARAYLVQDHEPDFYGASASRCGRGDLPPGAALHRREPLAGRAPAGALRGQRDATSTLRSTTPCTGRRARLARADPSSSTPAPSRPGGRCRSACSRSRSSRRRRPGRDRALRRRPPPRGSLRAPQLGVLDPRRLAALYAEATVGMVLSLTNPSLVASR